MDAKKTIFLALGHVELENYLKQSLEDSYVFLGETVYKEGIMKALSTSNTIPDILVVRETLPGNADLLKIIYEIRRKFPDIRIIFLAGNRSVGDKLLKALVDCGVYDILYGASLYAPDIIDLINHPNSFKDVAYLQGIPDFSQIPNKPTDDINIEISSEKEKEDKNALKFPIVKKSKISLFKELKKSKPINKEIPSKIEEAETSPPVIQDNPKETLPEEPVKALIYDKKTRNKSDKKEKIILDNKKLIVFLEAKGGVGTTQVSFNTAIALAEKGYKTLFVEYNKTSPQISYLLDKWKIKEGIDSVITNIKQGKKAIEDGIIRDLGENYPKNLDLMFFSKSYIAGIGEDMDNQYVKDFLIGITHSLGYDKVIIDYALNINSEEVMLGIEFADKIFSVITQDPSTIGYYGFKLNELKKNNISLENKHTIIINKYIENTKLNTKTIGEWLNIENIKTIGDYSKEIIDSNLSGEAMFLNKSNKMFIKEITEIIDSMNNN